jgi:hypothetical protein
MTDKATIDERLRKLLTNIDVFVSTEPNMDNKRKMDVYVKNIKSLLLEVVREVVGEEEKYGDKLTPTLRMPKKEYRKLIRNELRYEILERCRQYSG